MDCPEFLVYFPALEKLAELFGLMLIGKQKFANYFKVKYTHVLNVKNTISSLYTIVYAEISLEFRVLPRS